EQVIAAEVDDRRGGDVVLLPRLVGDDDGRGWIVGELRRIGEAAAPDLAVTGGRIGRLARDEEREAAAGARDERGLGEVERAIGGVPRLVGGGVGVGGAPLVRPGGGGRQVVLAAGGVVGEADAAGAARQEQRARGRAHYNLHLDESAPPKTTPRER